MPPPILVCSTPATAPPALWTDAAGRAVTLQRPRTDKQKTFTGFDAVARSTEELEAAVAPHVREAVAQGTSLLVAALGAPASGKSTSMRSSGGVAMTAAREIFDALSSAQNNHSVETLVVVSGVVAAIALPTDGKTPLTGKQPTRERLLDALLPAAVPQPAARPKLVNVLAVGDLAVRERDAVAAVAVADKEAEGRHEARGDGGGRGGVWEREDGRATRVRQ